MFFIPRQLYRMGEALAFSVIARHARRLQNRAKLVANDLDPTDVPTHGAQQLSFFNSSYDNACYLPMIGIVTFNDEAEEYLCGLDCAPAMGRAGAVGILRRLVRSIAPPKDTVLQSRKRMIGGKLRPIIRRWAVLAHQKIRETPHTQWFQVAILVCGNPMTPKVPSKGLS